MKGGEEIMWVKKLGRLRGGGRKEIAFLSVKRFVNLGQFITAVAFPGGWRVGVGWGSGMGNGRLSLSLSLCVSCRPRSAINFRAK